MSYIYLNRQLSIRITVYLYESCIEYECTVIVRAKLCYKGFVFQGFTRFGYYLLFHKLSIELRGRITSYTKYWTGFTVGIKPFSIGLIP